MKGKGKAESEGEGRGGMGREGQSERKWEDLGNGSKGEATFVPDHLLTTVAASGSDVHIPAR